MLNTDQNTDAINTFEEAYQRSLSKCSEKAQLYLEYERVVDEFKYRSCKSWEESEACIAQGTIDMARNQIFLLRAKIEMWEKRAESSRKAIQEYKRKHKSEEANKRGKPPRNKYREQVVKKFTMKWVASLMASLEAKGCGTQRGLEWMVPTIQERTWRRWLNGESLPPYSTIEDLLIVKVSHGKYAGEFLYNVPVVPNHNQILTLLQFI